MVYHKQSLTIINHPSAPTFPVWDLALFNLAINSKLRACDLTKLRVRDIAHGDQVSMRAIVMQQNQRQRQDPSFTRMEASIERGIVCPVSQNFAH